MFPPKCYLHSSISKATPPGTHHRHSHTTPSDLAPPVNSASPAEVVELAPVDPVIPDAVIVADPPKTTTPSVPDASDTCTPATVVASPGSSVSPLGSSKPPPAEADTKEKPDGSVAGTAGAADIGIVKVPTTTAEDHGSREMVRPSTMVAWPGFRFESTLDWKVGRSSGVSAGRAKVCVLSMMMNDAELPMEMGIVPSVVCCPGMRLMVRVLSMTTKDAELSTEMGMVPSVVRWPGTMLMGPVPGIATVGGEVSCGSSMVGAAWSPAEVLAGV